MWRSVPRALCVGYALPVLVIAMWIVVLVASPDPKLLPLSEMQIAASATGELMIAVGAFQVARAHSGWRVVAARVAGVAGVFRLAAMLASIVVYTFAIGSERALWYATTAIIVLEYVGSISNAIVAAGLSVTSRRLTIALVIAALGLALFVHPPPPLSHIIFKASGPVWISLLSALAPLGMALVVLGAVGDGLRGKRLGLRRIASAVRGCRLAGFVAWGATIGAVVCMFVALADDAGGAIAMAIASTVVAIGLLAAATSIARAHHEAISSLLVNVAFAGACATAVASCYLLERWCAIALNHPVLMSMWVRGDNLPLSYMPAAALGGGFALACLGFALWRYARHRRAPRLARELAIRLAASVIAPAVAFAATDEPAIFAAAIAVGSAALAGGFFAAARELERDVVDPTAAVFA